MSNGGIYPGPGGRQLHGNGREVYVPRHRNTYHDSRLSIVGDCPGAAQIAHEEAKMGFLVTVCASCVSAETAAALKGADNVSHGLCKSCFNEAMKEFRK